MPIATRLLLIDPKPLLAEVLRSMFSQHGEFTVDHSLSVADGLAQLASERSPELILLSDDIEDLSHTCTKLRHSGFNLPIFLICTDSSLTSEEQLRIFDAQDALSRPFRYGVLVARLRQLIRVHEQSDEAVFQIGPFLFHPAEKVLSSDAEDVKLTDKEAAILKALHRAGGKPISREVLLGDVWGYNSGITTHTLETHIYRLRQKLEPQSTEPTLLVTDKGGYRLTIENPYTINR